jgi:hypothetical protein
MRWESPVATKDRCQLGRGQLYRPAPKRVLTSTTPFAAKG